MLTTMDTTMTADERLDLAFEVKAFAPERREIEGIASTADRDLGGDVVQVPGAFARTIAEKGAAGVEFRVNHDMSALPIGAIQALEERAEGLYMRARVFATGAGDDFLATVRELLAMGKAVGLSIGYSIRPGGYRHDRVDGKLTRVLTDLDLREISVTTTPMNTSTRITSVKQAEAPAVDDEAELRQCFEHAATMTALEAIAAEQELLDGPAVDSAKRLIRGYPVVWDAADVGPTRDKVDQGTFAQQLAEGLDIPLLINHAKADGEIGRLVAADVDDVGLLCVFQVHDDDRFPFGAELLQQLHDDLADGTLVGLSAGYTIQAHTTHTDQTSRHVTRAMLTEVSLLLGQQPAQPEASVSSRRTSIAQLKAELDEAQRWLDEQARKEGDQLRRDFTHAGQQNRAAMSSSERYWVDQEAMRARVVAGLQRDYPRVDWEARVPAVVRPEAFDQAKLARERRERDLKWIGLIDQAQTKRLYDRAFARGWDAEHPGGGDRCSCRGHRLWRREIEPGHPPDPRPTDPDRALRRIDAEIRLAEATRRLEALGIPVPSLS